MLLSLLNLEDEIKYYIGNNIEKIFNISINNIKIHPKQYNPFEDIDFNELIEFNFYLYTNTVYISIKNIESCEPPIDIHNLMMQLIIKGYMKNSIIEKQDINCYYYDPLDIWHQLNCNSYSDYKRYLKLMAFK